MDDMKISLSVPATIYSFGETERPLTLNKYVTHAKLKLFYVGKTPDRRVFTKQFSDQLLQSLPGTPVVAYYSEEKKDFIGHNPTQYVFGYVPEMATIEYRSENDAQYAVTDVLLFTGRQDAIGEIANKIIGKPHSLELDPASIEYEIIRAAGKIDSITFRKGNFIGLSVLGSNEKPAFTGSQFFTESSDLEVFMNSYKQFKEEVESYKSGGQEMNEENDILPTVEDAVVSETEVFTEVTEIVEDIKSDNLTDPETSFADNKPVIIGEDREPGMDPYADVAADPTLAPKVMLEKAAPMEDNSWDMEGKVEEPTTTPMEQTMVDSMEETNKPVVENWEGGQPGMEEPMEEPMGMPEVEVKVEVEPKEEEGDDLSEDAGELSVSDMPVEKPKLVLKDQNIEPMSYASESNESFVENVVVSKEEVDVKQSKEEKGEFQEVSNTSALNDAERQELNAYRKAAKFELIDSYIALSEDLKNKFKANHESFTLEVLDKELAYELVKSQRQMKQSEIKMFSIPTMVAEAPKTEKEKLQALVEKYRDK